MSIALVHYHLRPGGVTRIVERQSKALNTARIPHVILTGSHPQQESGLPVRVIPGLDYSALCSHQHARASTLMGEMRASAKEALGGDPECWHLHNPTLGKNRLFPKLVRILAESEVPLVMHIHDLAEDGRPENYHNLRGEQEIYPLAPQIHYLTINSRDLALLKNAGIPSQQISQLRNAIGPTDETSRTPFSEATSPLLLYPVRGIRRKNLGEFCLLAALAPEKSRFVLALPPGKSSSCAGYRNWVTIAEKQKLPVQLGAVGVNPPSASGDSSFQAWTRASTHFISTSIAEGFGLTFLEAVAFGRPLVGRDLPEITTDFRDQGIHLPSLYSGLLIPRSWVDERRLQSLLETHLQHLYQSYGERLTGSLVNETANSLFGGELLDFGNLPETIQLEIIPRALTSPDKFLCRDSGNLIPASQWLKTALRRQSGNRPEDLDPWSLTAFANAHKNLYDSLTHCRAASPGWLEPGKVLRQYLQPERFHFLRS